MEVLLGTLLGVKRVSEVVNRPVSVSVSGHWSVTFYWVFVCTWSDNSMRQVVSSLMDANELSVSIERNQACVSQFR